MGRTPDIRGHDLFRSVHYPQTAFRCLGSRTITNTKLIKLRPDDGRSIVTASGPQQTAPQSGLAEKINRRDSWTRGNVLNRKTNSYYQKVNIDPKKPVVELLLPIAASAGRGR